MKIEKVIKSTVENGKTFKLVQYTAHVKHSDGYTRPHKSYMVLIEGADNKAYRVYRANEILSFTNKTKAAKVFNRIKKGEFREREWINTNMHWKLK